MDKGIRSGVNFKFNEMLPQLATIGGKAFRKEILYWAVENYDITIASACTHYNHSFQNAKKATPELVKGLGRPDDKNNGGRKKKVAVVVDAAPANFFPVGGFLLLARQFAAHQHKNRLFELFVSAAQADQGFERQQNDVAIGQCDRFRSVLRGVDTVHAQHITFHRKV